MERELAPKLPTTDIKGTLFHVDVIRQELREVSNPSNTISFLEMKDHGTHYAFALDADLKNLPERFGKTFTEVEIPQMATLDPEGMALHHGISIEDVNRKTDFEIIVNQELVALREKGALPVLEIVDHPFFVDLRLGSLRPKDDFRTMGHVFRNRRLLYRG